MSILLRIFSGSHIGAEIELPPGVYVLGTEDSCDIILHDSSLAARHAALTVIYTDQQEYRLKAKILDGSIILDGQSLEEENDLPPRKPFQMGQVFLAWTEAEKTNLAWQEVEELLTHRNISSLSSEKQTSDTSQAIQNTPLPETDANNIGTLTEKKTNSLADTSDDTERLPESPTSIRRTSHLRWILPLLAMGLAATLCITWNSQDTQPQPEDTVRKLLNEAGYHKLTATGTGNGVTITGRIASDKERGRLLQLAQFLHFPVYLNVHVRSDAAEAVRASFQNLGLYPEVTELPPSNHPGLLVRGYIKNGVLEEQALSAAKRDVPELYNKEQGTRLEIFRDIRHETDIQVLLAAALTSAGLDGIQTEYLPGRIRLHGALTPQSRSKLETLTEELNQKLGVTIPFDIINDAESLTSTPKKSNLYTKKDQSQDYSTSTSSPASQSNQDSQNFKISSVSAGEAGGMKFITLSNGERIFEGGQLPGGYTLEHISVDELTLKQDQNTISYPLRGNQ